MTTTRPYQVCLLCGAAPPPLAEATFIDVTPTAATAEAVLERLASCGVTPADLRARVVFAAGGDRDTALLTYAALVGFAGRRLDVAVADQLIVAADLDEAARAFADAGRPPAAVDHVQVSEVPHAELPTIRFGDQLSPHDVSVIRFARRVRFVPAADLATALTQLIAICGLRARGQVDRFPFLCTGAEPAVPADGADVVGVCLDALRRDAMELRRSMRTGDRDALAEPAELTARQRHLLEAASVDVEVALRRLGARQNAETGLWHCPRPERHTNGDQNPSMKAVAGKVRCFRCDPERVDSLRLVMDTLACSADEAADWLLSDQTRSPAA